MIYRNKTTGNILTRQDIQLQFSNTSFPAGEWDDQTLLFVDVEEVNIVEKPEDTDLYYFVEGNIENIDGKWTKTWTRVERFTEEELLIREQNQEAAKLQNIKTIRNNMLSNMDIVITKHNELLTLGAKPYSVSGVFDEEFIKEIYLYKESLRNFVADIPDINNVVFPADPFFKYDQYKSDYLTKESLKVNSVDDLNNR